MAPITTKHVQGMNRCASGIKGVLETLANKLKQQEEEIKADEAGKLEFERRLSQLREKKREIESRIDANMRWTASFDQDLGPFAKMYKAKTKEIASIYDDAKARHREGVKVLVNEFNYHPEFFRPKDGFHATPFVPK
ncbi:unnamed protein product [Ectocarpus sp. 4 AP-2014]